jgi:hypothetical protein
LKIAKTIDVDKETIETVKRNSMNNNKRSSIGPSPTEKSVSKAAYDPKKNESSTRPSPPLSKTFIHNSPITRESSKVASSKSNELKVSTVIKLQKMGRFMFYSGCCTLCTAVLVIMPALSVDRSSAFMYGFIYLGILFCTQLGNSLQLVAIRTSIR